MVLRYRPDTQVGTFAVDAAGAGYVDILPGLQLLEDVAY